MKRFQVKTGLIFASWALMLAFGCHQKKPPIPPQEQPPTVATVDQQPSPEPKPVTPEPQTTTPAQTEQPQATDKTQEKPSPKHSKPHTVKKPAIEPDKTPVEIAKSTPPEPPAPPRIVIQEGGSSAQSGQAGTGAPGDDNQATQQLLDSTDINIRNIEKRQLSANERSTLVQIKDYAAQSKQAMKDGDLVRAHNLAVKAHLLSDDLAKSK